MNGDAGNGSVVMSEERQDGWYWVRGEHLNWFVALWLKPLPGTTQGWMVTNNKLITQLITEIGPRIPSPDEANPLAAQSPNLFQSGKFTLHGGAESSFKIDCEALTEADLDCLARMISDLVGPFSCVYGVPTGGVRIANALRKYSTGTPWPNLIVDDVLTTGASMEEEYAKHAGKHIGAVIFARGPVPSWVTPLFTMRHKPPAAQGDALDLDALKELLSRWAHKSRTSPEEMEAWREIFYNYAPALIREVEQLRREKAELEADKKRVDLLESLTKDHAFRVQLYRCLEEPTISLSIGWSDESYEGSTIRTVLDAARAEEKKP